MTHDLSVGHSTLRLPFKSVKMQSAVTVEKGGNMLHVSIFSTHLYVLSEAFKGVNIKAFFASLQTGDNLLGFDAARSDRQT